MSTPGLTAAQGMRCGKFRHVYGDTARADKQFRELKKPLTSGESNYISANSKFIAVSKGAASGSVYILPLNKAGQISANQSLLTVQKGKVWDHDFHPFIPNIIATVSDDCSVKITLFPINGLTENIETADISMTGHTKKVILCQFNPCCNSVLATASFDRTIKIWNIEMCQNIITFKEPKDNIYSMAWNYNGSQLAMTGKDKNLRIFDPRQLNEASSTESFSGRKSSKVFWINNIGWIGASGFNKQAKRQIKFWDLKNLSKPIYSNDIDHSAAVNIPYYDNELGLLFMFGRGDGTVTFSEIINDTKKWYPLGCYRSPNPQKGGCFIPKRVCNVWKCEINRFLKLTKNCIEPISFIVPRKSGADVFQQDIFPNVYAGKPCLNSFKWINNMNKDPIYTMSMDPDIINNNNKNDEITTKIAAKYFIIDDINKLIFGYIRSIKHSLIIDNLIGIIINYYSLFAQFISNICNI